jgi:ribosome-binding factor A
MGELRRKKLEHLIKNEVSIILDRKVKDPKKKFITITEVRLNNDYSMAKVYFSSLGNVDEKEDAKKFLEKIKSYLRSELRNVLRLRKIPDLRFEIDNTFEYGMKIESLIQKIHEDDKVQPSGESANS